MLVQFLGCAATVLDRPDLVLSGGEWLMPATNIAVLKDKHRGADIFVIGSGATLDSVPKTFFAGRITVTLNLVHRDWPTSYMFSLHHCDCQEAIDKGLTAIGPDFDLGVTRNGNQLRGDYYSFHHSEQKGNARKGIDRQPLIHGLTDTLVMSACTIVSAMHFAAHLGAAAIWLCGVDGCTVDGRLNYAGYNEGHSTKPMHVLWTTHLVSRMAKALRRHGVPVMSLLPFVGLLRMEGRTLADPPRTWQDMDSPAARVPPPEDPPHWRCFECRLPVGEPRCAHTGLLVMFDKRGNVLKMKKRRAG